MLHIPKQGEVKFLSQRTGIGGIGREDEIWESRLHRELTGNLTHKMFVLQSVLLGPSQITGIKQ